MTPRRATFLVFGINGAMIGTWIAHIPWLQDHLDISKTTVGLCLLCMAAGALVSMPLTGSRRCRARGPRHSRTGRPVRSAGRASLDPGRCAMG